MKGNRIPTEYEVCQLMVLTGWSWGELQETPGDVVDRMRVYLSVKSVIENKGELRFDN